MTYQNLYYTDNHEHAAILLARKQVVESFYWAKGSAVVVFENEEECERILEGVLKGVVQVNPKSLIDALRIINNIINLNFHN